MKKFKSFILLILGLNGLLAFQLSNAQIYRISVNGIDSLSDTSVHSTDYRDTLFLVYTQPYRNDSVSYNYKVVTPDTNRRLSFEYQRSFPNHTTPNCKIVLEHNPLPDLTHEIYFVETDKIHPEKVILEKEKSFEFWMESNYDENTILLIMVEEGDWEGQCDYIVGRHVQLKVFPKQ